MSAFARLTRRTLLQLGLAGTLALSVALPVAAEADPLPSWNDGAAKTAIVDFVTRTTTPGPDFVAVGDRIATFDNDGTLWSEKPFYFQGVFVMDRIKAMAKDHPEWKDTQPFKGVLENDMKAVVASGHKGLGELLAASSSGMSVEDFSAQVVEWTKTAREPRFNKPYTDLVFQPMLELLAYLRANDYQTFIVSGGGVEFMRPWTEGVYGIPPQQVVGSSGKTEFKLDGDKVSIQKLPAIEFVDDGPGKPVGINRFIGKRPVFAAGNSDGDLEMLQWTTLNPGPRFGMIVHHTDAKREWAYDRDSDVGKLDKALDEAPKRGWTVVSMKDDWKVIYPFEK
ncbi:haloacid dehalogenase [Kaistia sp. 32K]|uniref:HAD family hydrolase n=1 Tax=Kaistia sp. 32K TaxID=2795690 RepID=UPI0019152CEF|nr:HAD family hydrolase [Kaistia sp. 32K]BCP52672.1 haloacid dehalogenase [Kaistia sp. 32K]